MKRDCDFMVAMEYNFEPSGPRRDSPRDGGHGFLPAVSCGRGLQRREPRELPSGSYREVGTAFSDSKGNRRATFP